MLLEEKGFEEEKLKVIFNSLDYDTHLKLRSSDEIKSINKSIYFKKNELPYLIFVGRLTKFKKIDLLIKALSIINKSDLKVNLLLVGDGSEKENLVSLTVSENLIDYIHFYGASYDEKELAKLIYHADLCVSPGNVGLTAIHALSYGTPVCSHCNFLNQMPEVEAIELDKTGCFFEEGNIESLAKVVKKYLENSKSREKIRQDCYKIIDSFYNPYYQLEVIKKL